MLVDYSFDVQDEDSVREEGDFSRQSPEELAEIAQANHCKIVQCRDFPGPEEFLLHVRELERIRRSPRAAPRVEVGPPQRSGPGCYVM